MAGSFLAGVRVLDLSIWRPGPYATSLLCALGADVVKVEPPGGDPMRRYPGLFEEINAGKRSVVLDLKTPTDRDRAQALATETDVLVEGFRPGVVARLGLDEPGLRRVNAGLVYCSISGYGQEGDRALVPGHDVNYQAWSGALAPEGGPATMPPLPVADLAAGLSAAFGVCAALAGRTTSGRGARLDISMTDVLSTWTGRSGPTPAGTAPTTVPGYGLFDTADGRQVSVGVVDEQHFWAALCAVVGAPGPGRPGVRGADGGRRGSPGRDRGRRRSTTHRGAGRRPPGRGRAGRAGARPRRDARGGRVPALSHPSGHGSAARPGSAARRTPRRGLPRRPFVTISGDIAPTPVQPPRD